MSLLGVLIVTFMQNLVTIMMAAVFGIVAFFLAPALLGLTGQQRSVAAARQYVAWAMTALGRALLVKHSQGGGYTLKKTKVDYSLPVPAETTRMGGENKAWVDPQGYMTTLAKKPFGIAHEEKNIILDARTIWAGQEFKRLRDKGEFTIQAGGNTLFKNYFSVPDLRPLVNVDNALPVIQGSADPSLPNRVKSYTEKAQYLFNSSKTMEYLVWLMGLGAGMGLMFLASRVKQTADGGTTIAFDTTLNAMDLLVVVA